MIGSFFWVRSQYFVGADRRPGGGLPRRRRLRPRAAAVQRAGGLLRTRPERLHAAAGGRSGAVRPRPGAGRHPGRDPGRCPQRDHPAGRPDAAAVPDRRTPGLAATRSADQPADPAAVVGRTDRLVRRRACPVRHRARRPQSTPVPPTSPATALSPGSAGGALLPGSPPVSTLANGSVVTARNAPARQCRLEHCRVRYCAFLAGRHRDPAVHPGAGAGSDLPGGQVSHQADPAGAVPAEAPTPKQRTGRPGRAVDVDLRRGHRDLGAGDRRAQPEPDAELDAGLLRRRLPGRAGHRAPADPPVRALRRPAAAADRRPAQRHRAGDDLPARPGQGDQRGQPRRGGAHRAGLAAAGLDRRRAGLLPGRAAGGPRPHRAAVLRLHPGPGRGAVPGRPGGAAGQPVGGQRRADLDQGAGPVLHPAGRVREDRADHLRRGLPGVQAHGAVHRRQEDLRPGAAAGPRPRAAAGRPAAGAARAGPRARTSAPRCCCSAPCWR